MYLGITNKSSFRFADNPEVTWYFDPDADVGEWHHYLFVIDDQTNHGWVYVDGYKVIEHSGNFYVEHGAQQRFGLGASETRLSGINPIRPADVTIDELIVWGGIGADIHDGGCLLGEFCNGSGVGDIVNHFNPPATPPLITGYVASYSEGDIAGASISTIVKSVIVVGIFVKIIIIFFMINTAVVRFRGGR